MTCVFWRDSMHFNRNRPPMVLNTTFMNKLNWNTCGVIYKLVIFMQRGWSGWRKTLLKYYFSTSFIPYWGFIFRGGMWLEILRLVSLISIILDTLFYISIYNLPLIILMQYTWLCLYSLCDITLCQHNIVVWISMLL